MAIVKECHVCGKEKPFYRTSSRCKSCMRSYQGNRDNFYRAKQYPAPLKSIYAIYDDQSVLQWIGESKNTPIRLYTHFNKLGTAKGVIDKVDNMDGWRYEILWSGENDLERKILERKFIKELQPVLNKQFK